MHTFMSLRVALSQPGVPRHSRQRSDLASRDAPKAALQAQPSAASIAPILALQDLHLALSPDPSSEFQHSHAQPQAAT